MDKIKTARVKSKYGAPANAIPKQDTVDLEAQKQNFDTTLAQLKQASEMLKEGIITRQEFDKIKDRLIQ